MEKASDRIMLAIDVDRIEQALLIVLEIGDAVGLFKVGLQMLANSGPAVFAQILKKHSNAKFFYDAKFHDIPLTVASASKNSCELPGIEFFSVHASGGRTAMRAAVEASVGGAKALAITVLTSLSDEDCEAMYGADRTTVVHRFATWAGECNMAGVVCSPLELEMLKDHPMQTADGRQMLKVVPGIRPEWARTHDQKATATPFEAIRDGADYLVIGRPITKAPSAIGSPLAAVHSIAQEIERGLEARKKR
nr:orotidine 5'-phosphate decarboxylase-like [Nerophis lumbriciformis]